LASILALCSVFLLRRPSKNPKKHTERDNLDEFEGEDASLGWAVSLMNKANEQRLSFSCKKGSSCG